MQLEFHRYFFRSIFLGKGKQGLVILAMVGLFISAFALFVLQSTMGGLQSKLVGRSQLVQGVGVLELYGDAQFSSDKILEKIQSHRNFQNLLVVPELELELLVRRENYVSPLIIRGVAVRPDFLPPEGVLNLVLGSDLAFKLKATRGDELKLMSPAHTDLIMIGEIPRMSTVILQESILTDVPEVDSLHGWIRLSALQNMIRSREVNRLRFFGEPPRNFDHELSSILKTEMDSNLVRYLSWEDQHETLVWALNLETTVMVFLFISMTFLVSLCITSGLLVFFDKIRSDLASFWILGASRNSLDQSSALFLILMTLTSVLLGLAFGGLFLYVLDQHIGEIMPAGFVDRKIPVRFSTSILMISFLVPVLISLIFSFWSLIQFKRDNDFLETVRSVG